MILSNVTRFPIILIGPPRSGSSVTCAQIGIDLNIKHFNDVTYSPDTTEMEKFLDYIKSTDQYILKFHSFDIEKYPNWLTEKIYKGETYNVKLKRNNLLLNIASSYIAQVRKLYHYYGSDISMYSKPIEIKSFIIEQCIVRIRKAIAELESLTIPFDNVITYEDHVYDDIAGIKTPLPSNYAELLKAIEKLL
jgi:hypothetical protein